ncbi:hypothetical protein BC829DRAFT_179373 [Chytridium lagenaria]|nr:hypothetical protein BC829DRAFT_179373 [Chytridium lagenaria]
MDNFHAFERPADFSSFGPSPHLDVKPDIAAPGTFIISTYLTTNGSYAILSGTSMSTPLIAGTAALLLSHRPSLTPIQVKSLLMNTASPGKGLNGAYPHPAVIGSGIAKVTAAMSSPLIFEPPSIALGYLSSGDTVFVDAKLKWVDRIPGSVTYKVHVEGPVPLELITTGKSTFTTGNLTSPWNCTVDVSPSVITIGTAFPSAKVRFTVTPTSRSSSYHTLLLHGGHIIATPLQLSHSQPSLRIPFQFVTGDNTYSGALICRYEATCIPTFTISNHTILQFSLLMPVTSVTVFLLNTETGMNVGYIDAAEFLGKSGKNHPRYAVEWNGGSVYGNSKRDVKILALAKCRGRRWLRKKSLREHKEKLHGIQRGSYRVCIEAMFDVMGMNNPVRDRWCSHRFKRSLCLNIV